MGYDKPNFTQTPNLLFDEQMAVMGNAELRVTLAIVRQTFGWHKESDVISLSQLIKMTGLSRQGVVDGVKEGLERGTIKRYPEGQSFTYQLVIDEPTSQPTRPVLVNVVDQQLVNVVDTQKKGLNKDKESIEADACEASPSPAPTENILFPLQEKGLVTKPKTRRTPTPPTVPAPPSPSRNPAAAALSAKNRELLKEFEPKARPIWAAIEKQINALAAGDNPMTPEEYEHVFRALKRDPWWANKPLTPSIVGKQAGAILPHVKNQVTMELNYEW